MQKENKKYVITIICAMLVANFLLILGWTYSALVSKKMMTSSVTFEFVTPPMYVSNEIELYYANDELTFGSCTQIGNPLAVMPNYNISINDASKNDGYYIKVEYKFENLFEIVDFIENEYQVGDTTMGIMTAEESTQSYISTSNSLVSANAQLNILSYLNDLTINNTASNGSQILFEIVVTVDDTNNFNSSKKNQLSFNGIIGIQ